MAIKIEGNAIGVIKILVDSCWKARIIKNKFWAEEKDLDVWKVN